MPGAATAELIFIAAMMVLILIFSFSAVYFFFRQYKKETGRKRERAPEKPKTAREPTE
jgi:hypothetical protein